MDEDEAAPDPLAALDQAMAQQRAFAALIRAHFVALVESGFSEAQGMTLTVTFAQALAAKVI